MLEQERAKVMISLYKAKEHLTRKPTNPLLKVQTSLKIGFTELERCESVTARARMELALKNCTSETAFLWQEKLVAEYHIFGTMLGLLDARYDYEEQQVKFYSNFQTDEYKPSSIEQAKERQKKLLCYREKVVADSKSMNMTYGLTMLAEIIECVPSHQKFSRLFNDMVSNHFQLSLQGEFISAYLDGYNASMNFYPKEAMDTYEQLLIKFQSKMEKHNRNEAFVKQIGTMNKEE